MKRRRARGSWLGIFLGLLAQSAASTAEPVRNGFVLDPASIPTSEILAGGPARDGIPALDHPTTLPAERADWSSDERILGVVLAG